MTTRDLPAMWKRVGLAAGALLAATVARRSAGAEPVSGDRPAVDPADSYYGNPIINPPVWEERDIAGYLFAGGLAGASSILAAGADLTGRPRLARRAKLCASAPSASRWPR